MQSHAVPAGAWAVYAVSFVLIGIVLYFRVKRLSRSRPLKIEQLWIVPAIYGGVAAYMFYQFPPAGALGWSLCGVALLLGGALGWQRGKMMHIEVDPETHALNQRASASAVVFLVALIAVRTVLRALMVEGQTMLHLNAMTLTDVLIALALGLFAVQRLEMYLRAKRMLAEARAARAV